MTSQEKNKIISDHLLWETRLSIFHYPALTVASELGLFEAIGRGALSLSEISEKLKIGIRGATALCNILWGLGFLECRAGKFRLTAVSKTYSVSWKSAFELFHDKQAHQELLAAIKKDGSSIAFQGKSYSQMWEEGDLDEEAAARFTRRMHSYVTAPAIGAAKKGIFRGVKSLLDVGGGSGAFCLAIAKAEPKTRAVVFDLPAVCKVAEGYIQEAGLSRKVKTISGNFFKETLPQGFDGILFSNILHDWPPERCETLVQSAFEALPKGGKIFLHEMVFDPAKKGPLVVSCFSMLMFLAHPGAQQYSEKELSGFLKKAGFKKPTLRHSFGYYSVVTATK